MNCSTLKSVYLSSPTDLDECKSNMTNVCPSFALCTNTYGSYRCFCNGTEVYGNQSCILGESLNIFPIYPADKAPSLQQCL